MFAVFRSLHMKLMLILLLLITSLMAVVGAFLTTSVSSFYIDTFYEQISAVFSDDSDGYVSTLRARAAEPDGAAGIKEMLEGRAGSLGIDYRTRNYFILDGQSGTYLDGSAEASELPREQTANLLTARNAVAQGDSTLVGDRSDITADYMDAAIPIMGGGNAYIIYILDNKDTVTDLNSQLFLIIMQALVIGLLISVLLSFLLSKTMVGPIEKLTAAWNLRSFGELSDIPYNAIWDLSTQKSCAENIFQINYIQNNADLGSTWNYLFGPSKTGITSNKVGLMQNMTTKSVYDAFAKEDVRKNYLRETTVAGVTYYHTMKYADLECGANGYGGNNWIVMRYADVALMLAEAYYWQGTEPTAKSFLNMVRKRAGLGDWSGTDLRQGIYDERRNEFIQEGLRWQDLLRMYSKQEMIEHFNAINPNFGLKDLLLPIPYNERILNTEGLYQNPGYGVK